MLLFLNLIISKKKKKTRVTWGLLFNMKII